MKKRLLLVFIGIGSLSVQAQTAKKTNPIFLNQVQRNQIFCSSAQMMLVSGMLGLIAMA